MKIIKTLLFSLFSGAISAQVGIGTTSPSSALDIEATGPAIDINDTGGSDPVVNFQSSGTTAISIGIDNDDSDKFKIGATIDANSPFTVETGGNVTINDGGQAYDFRVEGDTEENLFFVDGSADVIGIGTASPTYILHVYNSDAASGCEPIIETNNTRWAGITYKNTNRAWFSGIPSGGASRFALVDNTAGEERVSVNTSGYVGIGTTSASTMLQLVNDDATDSGIEDMLTITKSTSGTPAAGIGAGLIFQIEDGGDTEEQGRIDVELEDVTNASEDATMTFNINQAGTITEIMRIDGTAGYVGIGTTSPANLLDVDGDMILQNGTSINEFSTDGTLAGNSDDAVPTEQAVKTYVDGLVPTFSKTITIEAPTNTDYFPIFRTDVAITIQEAIGMLNAAGDVDVTLYWDTDFAESAPTAVGTTTTLSTTSEATVNIGSDATIPADSWIFIDIPEATSSQTVTVDIRYTED